jgi:hypothetical protein
MIEQSERINADQRKYGPLEGVVIRANWLRDSRGSRVDTTITLRADGTISFGHRVEPHIVERLVLEVRRLDANPELSRGVREILTETHVRLTELGRGAPLPPVRLYVEAAERRLESHIRSVITPGTGAPTLTPRRTQAIANLVFCQTVARAGRGSAGAGRRLASGARDDLRDTIAEIKNVFVAGVFPAAGPEPNTASVAAGLADALALAEAHGSDVGGLFSAMRQRAGRT